jgi:hypothetical protein
MRERNSCPAGRSIGKCMDISTVLEIEDIQG